MALQQEVPELYILIYTRIELHVGKKKNTFEVHVNVIFIKCLTPRPFFGKKAFNL